jgi:hypothetical protein
VDFKLILLTLVLAVAVLGSITFEFVLKQEPFATAEEYWAQLENHRLTLDVRGHWNYVLSTVDVISYSQAPYFDVPDPYDPGIFKRWIEEHGDDPLALERVYQSFYETGDWGWAPSLRGIPWVQAAIPIIWAAPSVAIIEPGRTAEVAFVIRELIELLRSPAGWMDYSIIQGWGDPMVRNVQWRAPLLIAEGLYALITGDKEAYCPETVALARGLYEEMLENLKLPLGEGYCGGVACEPNHWFPQCNAMAVLGLAIYDQVYGPDEKHGLLIGEEYRKHYMQFIREHMSDPETGLVYRRWHPFGPQQADKDLSGFANIMVALLVNAFEPEFASNLYEQVRLRYIRRYPFGIGAFMLEVPERGIRGEVQNPGAWQPGMLGETYLNVFLAWAASREFDDPETFDGINCFLTNLAHPYFLQAEVRFDETNPDPAGIDDYTVGQLLNMYSGWWLFAKVHLGWRTILEHDWSQNRDADGRPLNNP